MPEEVREQNKLSLEKCLGNRPYVFLHYFEPACWRICLIHLYLFGDQILRSVVKHRWNPLLGTIRHIWSNRRLRSMAKLFSLMVLRPLTALSPSFLLNSVDSFCRFLNRFTCDLGLNRSHGLLSRSNTMSAHDECNIVRVVLKPLRRERQWSKQNFVVFPPSSTI